MIFSILQNSIAVLQRTLFPCDTSDSISLAHHGVGKVFKITVKDLNLFLIAKLVLRALNNFSEIVI